MHASVRVTILHSGSRVVERSRSHDNNIIINARTAAAAAAAAATAAYSFVNSPICVRRTATSPPAAAAAAAAGGGGEGPRPRPTAGPGVLPIPHPTTTLVNHGLSMPKGDNTGRPQVPNCGLPHSRDLDPFRRRRERQVAVIAPAFSPRPLRPPVALRFCLPASRGPAHRSRRRRRRRPIAVTAYAGRDCGDR